jgi:hypothetical protein
MAIIDAPEFVAEFRALSALEKPAVQAIGADVAPIIESLPTKSERDAANQFCGWYVGQIMRRDGYRLVRERGRVTGAPFKTGAVWEFTPADVQVVFSLPGNTPRRIELSVTHVSGGDMLATWEAVETGGNPGRRIRTIVEGRKKLEDALANAISYAKRWKFQYVLIRDTKKIIPTAKLNRLLVRE